METPWSVNYRKRDVSRARRGIPPLVGEGLEKLAVELGGGWEVIDEDHLDKEFAFRNFKEALELDPDFDFNNCSRAVA